MTTLIPPPVHNASAMAEIFLIKRTKNIIKFVETLKRCQHKVTAEIQLGAARRTYCEG